MHSILPNLPFLRASYVLCRKANAFSCVYDSVHTGGVGILSHNALECSVEYRPPSSTPPPERTSLEELVRKDQLGGPNQWPNFPTEEPPRKDYSQRSNSEGCPQTQSLLDIVNKSRNSRSYLFFYNIMDSSIIK